MSFSLIFFKFLLIIFYIKSRKIKGLHGFRVAILSLMNTFFILIPPISDAFKSVHFTDQNSDLAGYKIAPMDSYFPLDDNDNSLSILQKMPDKSMGYFILTGVNSRMGLTGVPGCATYTFYREINNYGSIIAITSQGTKIRTWDNGTLGNWQSHVLSSYFELLNGIVKLRIENISENRILINLIKSDNSGYRIDFSSSGLKFEKIISFVTGGTTTIWSK